jgi:enoyl-[acyl-carrier-protein] reductase (NADH)
VDHGGVLEGGGADAQDHVPSDVVLQAAAGPDHGVRDGQFDVGEGERGARINTISPGIIFTPLARDELTGPRGEGYRRMIEQCPVGRGGTPDEVGTVGALLMGPEGAFITGSDFLMDGGVTASYFYGELAPQ